jgi:uncharacterized protein YbcC (UPF0753/DUF2309 family)
MVYVAGEPVPFFWPMRSFIHHNPLHGLEHLPFDQAVQKGATLFQARGFLPRSVYQGYLADGRLDSDALAAELRAFAAAHPVSPGIDLAAWARILLEQFPQPLCRPASLAGAVDVRRALHRKALATDRDARHTTRKQLRALLLGDRPVYESVDALYGTGIGDELDELVVRSCLDFFDEGQSVWVMPDRERGFFAAWRQVGSRPVQALLERIERSAGDDGPLTPERVIDHIMRSLQVPEEQWTGYFTREIVRLHGWAGFVRWRATAGHYYWANRYPGDLVDLLAIRLTLAWQLLDQRAGAVPAKTRGDLEHLIEACPQEAFLRLELNSGKVLPAMAHRVDTCLARCDVGLIERTFDDYVLARRTEDARHLADELRELAGRAGAPSVLEGLDSTELAALLDALRQLEVREGMLWLRSLEAAAMQRLFQGISLEPPPPRDKRPFVQAAFCIDTRSERIRRHLESVGDYQTFGIAGFFGVPVSLMELGKGSEAHLCPVLLTPKNLVLEMSAAQRGDEAAVTTLERALHKLKESVLTPFVTVEAIGLLFGFDMIGKTVAPEPYHRWRRRLLEHKPGTHLLQDKLSRGQADSVVRAVQRAVIEEAAAQELGLEPEDITDGMVRELREAALGNADLEPDLIADMKIAESRVRDFVLRLRSTYRINPAFAQLQLEQLARIGFSLEEQAGFVYQALSSIGLTTDFSRFILLVGHGSRSQNNPYESALDCGACGGNHGLTNARVLSQMANKPAVRRRLAERGIEIPDDVWFLPALHNTTTDEITLHDLELLPTSHLVYLGRLRNGLTSAARLCAQERLPALQLVPGERDPAAAVRVARRNAVDWSQVRPEWGLARNTWFVIGRRSLTRSLDLDGRAFLHSYDYRVDRKRRLLENILAGPLVVGQWINMEHYFSTVDNERFGSGSKVYHNVAGRFGVMTGNLGDLRTGLPSQTVLDQGLPHHEPLRLVTLIEAPFERARAAVENVVAVKRLVRNGWIRLAVVDPETALVHIYDDGEWLEQSHSRRAEEESLAS